jgi:DNA-binding GntR family transcriptional regulator
MTDSGYRTAHQYALDRLRTDILSGNLGVGGVRLVQGELAARLGMSTTPVREALRDLATEGLILFDSHKGAVVREISQAEFIDLYEVRMLLEPLAMARAAERVTPTELAEARRLAEAMETESDGIAWAKLNREFHQVLQRAAGFPVLEQLLDIVQDQSAMYTAYRTLVSRSRRGDGNAEHRALLKAVADGDADSASAAAYEHLRETLAIMDVPAGKNGTTSSPALAPANGRKAAPAKKAAPQTKAAAPTKAAKANGRKATPASSVRAAKAPAAKAPAAKAPATKRTPAAKKPSSS